MPPLSAKRIARDFISEACAKAVAPRHFLAYYDTVTDDAKLVVYAYSIDPAAPTSVTCTPITDKAVILASRRPESVPAPAGRIVKDAPEAPQAAPSAPAKAAGKR